MEHVITYILVVGIGSTIVLDLWAVISSKIGWLPGTHWPSVGRWMLGILSGRWVLDTRSTMPNTFFEGLLGWAFHYLIGIAYAVAFPLFWGVDFIAEPTVLPFFIIGVVVSSLMGLMILMPGLGGGFFARKTPSPTSVILFVIVTHTIFAIAEYLLALLFV